MRGGHSDRGDKKFKNLKNLIVNAVGKIENIQSQIWKEKTKLYKIMYKNQKFKFLNFKFF